MFSLWFAPLLGDSFVFLDVEGGPPFSFFDMLLAIGRGLGT
jgi:hypothetical protein